MQTHRLRLTTSAARFEKNGQQHTHHHVRHFLNKCATDVDLSASDPTTEPQAQLDLSEPRDHAYELESCGSVLSTASSATVCSLQQIPVAEDVVLQSPDALTRFHDAIHHDGFPVQVEIVRSLTLEWGDDATLTTSGVTNLVCALRQLPNVKHVRLFTSVKMPSPFGSRIPIPDALAKTLATCMAFERPCWGSHSSTCRVAEHNHVDPPDMLCVLGRFAGTWANLRSLDTTVAVLLRISPDLCSGIVSLSVTITRTQQEEACSVVERLFGGALRKLKFIRWVDHLYSAESPARICARLGAKRLEYLEVRDIDITVRPVSSGMQMLCFGAR